MDWVKFVKRYVWDDEKTPYFVRVEKLTKAQARNEVFVYAFFLAILFGVTMALSLADADLHRSLRSLAAAVYASSLLCGAIVLALNKHRAAALYCMTAPLALFLIVVSNGLHPDLGTIDKVALITFTLLWLRYGIRVLAIAKAFDGMPEGGR